MQRWPEIALIVCFFVILLISVIIAWHYSTRRRLKGPFLWSAATGALMAALVYGYFTSSEQIVVHREFLWTGVLLVFGLGFMMTLVVAWPRKQRGMRIRIR